VEIVSSIYLYGMINLKENLFQNILGLIALFVAGVAAFFSVMGIGMLFSGAAVSAMVMASALECGKVIATSFLYRYWGKTTKFLKVYLISAIIILVGITSLGVFGWLSSAYQSSAMQYENTQLQTSSLIEQKKVVENQMMTSKTRIDSLMSMRTEQEKRMNETLGNTILSRNPTQLRQIQDQNVSLIKQTDSNISEENSRYNELYKNTLEFEKKIMELKTSGEKTKDVVTFKFVADALGWDLNMTVKWFIVVIIIVFDPLAVCLILSYNVVAYGGMKKQELIPINSINPQIDTPPISEEVEKKNNL
jgi:Tfp pilus assembly protein PilV